MQTDNYRKFKPIKRQHEDLYSEYKATQKATGLFTRRNEEKALDVANRFYNDNRAKLFQK